MKKLRKLTSFMLAGMMTATGLAGCSGENDKMSSAASAQGNSSQAADAAKTGEPTKASLVFVTPGTYENNRDNSIVLDAIKKKILKDRNIDLDLTFKECSWTGYQDLMQVEMAAGTQIDLFPAWSDMANGFISNETVFSLDESLEKHGQNIKKVIPEMAWRWMNVDGKIYGFPRLRAENDVQWSAIRKDWLDLCGLAVPTTFEELEKALYAFKEKDPVGNGNTIPYLMQASKDKDSLMTAPFFHLAANQMTDYYLAEDGTVRFVATNPNYKQALETTKKWFTDGIINKDLFSLSGDEREMRENQHVVGVRDMKKNGVVDLYQKLLNNYPDGEYAIMPFENYYEKSKLASDFLLVPANSKNLDQVTMYFDWMLESKENFLLANYGIEGTHYTKEDNMIDIIKAPDGEPGYYGGVYTGTFNMTGLPGYGNDVFSGLVKTTFADENKQKIFDNQFQTASKWMDEHMDLATVPNLYGFTYKLTDAAQQTRAQRKSAVSVAAAEFVNGTSDWSKVEASIQAYEKSTGGPEEIQQVNEQYKAWCTNLNAK